MENKIKTIMNESDLEYYEKRLGYLNCNNVNQSHEKIPRKKDLITHMDFHKGKLMRVEAVLGGCIKIKVGKLIEVGDDYICLKIGKEPTSAVIPIDKIHSVTIFHCM